MVFSSLLFLFAFLTPQLILYYLVKNMRARNVILLVFSLIFYSFGGPRYLLLLLTEAFIAFYTAKSMGRIAEKKRRKKWMILACILLLGLLAVFKYAGFFAQTLKDLFGFPEIVPEIVLPIGISFYTFQLLSYVADVYRGDVPAQKSYFNILLYCSLFHQCIAGPIVRYETVQNEIDHREIDFKDVSDGMRRFAIGLAKKALLANGAAQIADTFLTGGAAELSKVSTAGLYLGMFCYMLQIYLDFSAYSDMAIGMGRMVGFHYLENFDYPYGAGSVQSFWRKWHISLSTFFRDYIYSPLGGSRKGSFRTYLNLFIVWFLTGMWHGASWNYVLWGLYYFVFLAIERLFLGKLLSKNRFTKALGHVYTLIVVFFGWVFFKFTDFMAMKEVFKGLLFRHSLISLEVPSVLLNQCIFLLISVIACFPLGKMIRKNVIRHATQEGKTWLLTAVRLSDVILPILLLLLSVLALIGDSYNPFLYFQF